MNIDLYCTELCKLSYSNNRKNSLFISNVNTDCQCYIDHLVHEMDGAGLDHAALYLELLARNGLTAR